MIKEYDRVIIKKVGVIGIVVDISETHTGKNYIVESNEKGVSGGYGSDDSWKLFDCTEDELERID